MKVETERSTKENDFDNLFEIIGQKRWELMRLTNHERIVLFWKIGASYNHYLNNNMANRSGGLVLRNVSTYLVSKYGADFKEKNIKKMGYFAQRFADSTAMLNFSTVSWEHILLLISLENQEAVLFYIRLTVEQSLSVKSLSKHISMMMFEQSKISNHSIKKSSHDIKNANSILPIWVVAQRNWNYSTITNFFKNPQLSSFHSLIEPKPIDIIYNQNKHLSAIETDLLDMLSKQIKEFQTSYNKQLNTNFNMFLWEIGGKLKEEIEINESEEQTDIIQNIATKFEKAYGKTFNKEGLYNLLKCAEKFAERTIFTRFAYLITWEHVLVLLPLLGLETKLFYARLAAAQGLNADDLRKEVSKGTYEQTIGAKEHEQNAIVIMQNPVIKTTIKKEGNDIFKGTERFINFGDDIDNSLAINNIFNNNYFLEFITSF